MIGLAISLLFVYFLISLALLISGSVVFVKSASKFSVEVGIPKFAVGAVVMSLATTFPELMVSYTAVLQDQLWIAIGNIFGSYIANIGLVVGVSGLVRSITVSHTFFSMHMPFCVAALTFLILMSMKASFYWVDAFLVLLMIIPWMIWVMMDCTYAEEEVKVRNGSYLWPLIYLLIGGSLIYVGASILVTVADAIAYHFGLTSLSIGLTVVAVATSLPELSAGIVSAYYGEFELLLGNVLGANILLILFVFPITVMLSGSYIALTDLWTEYLFMGILTMLLWMFSAYFDREARMNRLESFMLLAVFCIYQAYTLLYV